MTQNQTDPKGLKDTNRAKKPAEENIEDRSPDASENAQEQVLNEEDQQISVNPTDAEGDSRSAFLDLQRTAGPGDDDDDDDDDDTDEDAGVSDPGTEIDIPFPDSDDDDTSKKIPSI